MKFNIGDVVLLTYKSDNSIVKLLVLQTYPTFSKKESYLCFVGFSTSVLWRMGDVVTVSPHRFELSMIDVEVLSVCHNEIQ